ncbi:hypothetical protein AUP68_09926 [Ilyonectria robusta]
MSQSTAKMDKGKNVATAPAPSVPTALTGTAVRLYRPSAMMLGGLGGQMFGAKSLGVAGHTITTTLKLQKLADVTDHLGFMLEMPLGKSNKDDGFGMTHWVDRSLSESIDATDVLRLNVVFPSNGMIIVVEDLEDKALLETINVKGAMSVVEVCLKEGAKVMVEGFGIPFSNAGQPVHEWLTLPATTPVCGDMTFVDILMQDHFTFVVQHPSGILRDRWTPQRLSDPFSYPYGDEHCWDMDRYRKQIYQNKGHQFHAAWSFDDNNSHMAAVSQSQVQDVFWLHEAVTDIKKVMMRAYFVESDRSMNKGLKGYAIVRMPEDFLASHDTAWRRLTNGSQLKLDMHYSSSEEPKQWKAMIVERPGNVEALKPYPLGPCDLALHHCVALNFDAGLEEFQRKVDIVCAFDSAAEPTNPGRFGHTIGNPHPPILKDRMSLHRALWRGRGFWEFMVYGPVDRLDALQRDVARLKKVTEGSQNDPASKSLVRKLNSLVAEVTASISQLSLGEKKMYMETLPVVNLLNCADQDLVNALVHEALPDDRDRFREYFSKRPLGLGIITAGPGFGKTTAVAAATLGMKFSVGPVFASAPTHVATDNFAARLDAVSTSVTERYNSGKEAQDYCHRSLVVRAYKEADEERAFMSLLQNPHLGNDAAPRNIWGVVSKWKLHLSAAYWLLMCLGSPAVRPLREDDPRAIHQLRAGLLKKSATDPALARLFEMFSGKITREQYVNEGKTVPKDYFQSLLSEIVVRACILCALPSLSQTQENIRLWKNNTARGIAVDEAANINRPDLYTVWGNTFLPCILAGDEKQLAPVVTTMGDADADGYAVNRLAKDGRISALEFLKGAGWPIYHLRTQLRMAVGQFGLCKETVYTEIESTYGGQCEITRPEHSIGVTFEGYITTKYPDVAPSPAGQLLPVFMHCKGSRCFKDKVTGSKRNPDQVKAALDFLCDFVQTNPAVDPAQILILSPYTAMIETITSMRKKPEYMVINKVRPASTVDSIQGQEGDMVVVITGTTTQYGPGFTTDERRLNVMLSRHKSALVIFGDIHVVGFIDQVKVKANPDEKEAACPMVISHTPEGDVRRCRPKMLRKVHVMLVAASRHATIDIRELGREEPVDGEEVVEAVQVKSKDGDGGAEGKGKGKGKGKGGKKGKGDKNAKETKETK